RRRIEELLLLGDQRRERRPAVHPVDKSGQVGIGGGVDRLAGVVEVDERRRDRDVGDRQASADEELLAGDLLVEPAEQWRNDVVEGVGNRRIVSLLADHRRDDALEEYRSQRGGESRVGVLFEKEGTREVLRILGI